MKDLEKIKSEDLGCQVQDANPGNYATFAIDGDGDGKIAGENNE